MIITTLLNDNGWMLVPLRLPLRPFHFLLHFRLYILVATPEHLHLTLSFPRLMRLLQTHKLGRGKMFTANVLLSNATGGVADVLSERLKGTPMA